MDQNCDGVDGIDSDRDGHASLASGGDDCDESDAAIHPGASDGEIWSIRTIESNVGHPDLGWTLDARFVGSVLELAYLATTEWDGSTPAPGEVRFIEDATVDPVEILPVGRGTVVEMRLFGTDRVRLLLTYHNEDDLHLLTAASDGWEAEVIGVAPRTSDAVEDGSGVVHAVYTSSSYELVHGTSDRNWQTELLDEDGDVPSVAVDRNGALHVVYTCCWDDEASLGMLRYATNSSGEWSSESIETWTAGPWAAIAVGEDGTVHIAADYSEPAWHGSEIRYLAKNGGDWESQVIAAERWNMAPSIAIDLDRAVHLAWWHNEDSVDVPGSEDRDQLHYAVEAGGQWRTEVVDPDGAYLPRIVIDPDGTPVIAYRWGPAPNLLAWRTGAIRVARRVALDGIDQDCDGSDG